MDDTFYGSEGVVFFFFFFAFYYDFQDSCEIRAYAVWEHHFIPMNFGPVSLCMVNDEASKDVFVL